MKALWILSALGVASLCGEIWRETPRGGVRGAIFWPGGDPAGVRVALVGLDIHNRGQWFRARANARGQFAIPDVVAGRYRAIGQRGRWRAEAETNIAEAKTTAVKLEMRRLQPNVPPTQPVRDEAVVARRTKDILDALPRLTPELLKTIRRNNRSAVRSGFTPEDSGVAPAPIPLAVLVAQAGAESSFRPALLGGLDEIGLFQLRPATASDQGLGPIPNARLLDSALSTRLASLYLGRLRFHFGDLRLALAAYNQGVGRTEREGLYPSAQIYADAILRAARHPRLLARLREVEISTKP